MLEKQRFLVVFHTPNQNSQDFPCFELTAKMTSLGKNLGVNSPPNLDMLSSIPKRITKSLEKLHFEYHCDVTGNAGTGIQKLI